MFCSLFQKFFPLHSKKNIFPTRKKKCSLIYFLFLSNFFFPYTPKYNLYKQLFLLPQPPFKEKFTSHYQKKLFSCHPKTNPFLVTDKIFQGTNNTDRQNRQHRNNFIGNALKNRKSRLGLKKILSSR